MNKLQVLIGIGIIIVSMSNTQETELPKKIHRVSKEHEEFVNNLLNKKTTYKTHTTKTSEIVDVTMYNAVVDQCDADPLITACMYTINPNRASEHKWIAMSRNLLKRWGGRFDFGDKVKIVGCGIKDGIYTVADVMNARFVNRVDILETLGKPMYSFKNIKIIKI